MIHEFREGFLHGTSARSEKVAEAYCGEFDYALLSSSWDKRCIAITKSEALKFEHSALLLPALRDDLGLRDEHDGALLRFANQTSDCIVLEGASYSIEELWYQLAQDVLRVEWHELKPKPHDAVAGERCCRKILR